MGFCSSRRNHRLTSPAPSPRATGLCDAYLSRCLLLLISELFLPFVPFLVLHPRHHGVCTSCPTGSSAASCAAPPSSSRAPFLWYGDWSTVLLSCCCGSLTSLRLVLSSCLPLSPWSSLSLALCFSFSLSFSFSVSLAICSSSRVSFSRSFPGKVMTLRQSHDKSPLPLREATEKKSETKRREKGPN